MIEAKLKLTDEQTSPLFRIMWVHNWAEVGKISFDNNICAFHVGQGNVLSVAHNLRTEAGLFRSITEPICQADLLPHFDQKNKKIFERHYPLDNTTNKRYLSVNSQKEADTLLDVIKKTNFDTRWITLTHRNFCRPFLIVQFRNNQFYNDNALTAHFNATTRFHEPTLFRYTFLIELELVTAYYNEDFAHYRVVNTNQGVIDKLPRISIDSSIINEEEKRLFCLQSAPVDNLGRLLNDARIEGLLDHWNLFGDRFGGNYTMDGLRYLIRGYFRFGSSGAPYVFYDEESQQFKANAIQSEASPIQLSINNSQVGNFQYVNAIASPIKNIIDRLNLGQ